MIRRLALRSIVSHPGRFALTVLAVTLGVGFVVGSFVVTDTLRSAIKGLFDDISGQVDVSVRAVSNLEASAQGGPTSRGRIPDSLVPLVTSTDGVAAAQPSISGYAQLIAPNGDAVTTTGAPLLGVSWGDVDEALPVTLDVGRQPSTSDEVAIDRDTADEYGFAVGDRTSVLLVGGEREVTIVGIFTFGSSNSLLGARLTAFSFDHAQDAFGAPGELDVISVIAEPGVTRQQLVRRLQERLPDGVEAVSIDTVNQEGADSVEGFLSIFQNVLLGFAAVALMVSAFFINNTFAILLGQRTRELALLRAVGAMRRQIVGSVVVESLVMGVAACVPGVGFGVVIAIAIQALLKAGGFMIPAHALQLSLRTVIAAVTVGVPVTTLAAFFPARRAAHVAPLAAIADSATAQTTGRGRRAVAGGAALAVAALALTASLAWLSGAAAKFSMLALGAAAAFGGVIVLSPLLAGPVSSVLGRLVARSVAGSLARENAVRSPHRVARAASALTIGLGLVSTVFVVGESMKATVAETVAGKVDADFIVAGTGFVGFSPTVADAIGRLDGIVAVTGVRFDTFVVDGASKQVTAADTGAASELIDMDVRAGSLTEVHGDAIAIHVDEASDRRLSVGDALDVELASGGPRPFEVAAIYADATYAGNFLIDLDTFRAAYPANNLDLYVFAKARPRADIGATRAAIDEELAPFPQLELQDRSEFEQSQRDQLDQILIAVNGLLGLALFIALMGISNTLALSVIERTREIGLLRAVGMDRGQVRRMVLVESAIVACFGALLGVALGLLLGIATAAALPDTAVAVIHVPWVTLGVIVVVAGVFGVVAGALPARRAARMDVLAAISRV